MTVNSGAYLFLCKIRGKLLRKVFPQTPFKPFCGLIFLRTPQKTANVLLFPRAFAGGADHLPVTATRIAWFVFGFPRTVTDGAPDCLLIPAGFAVRHCRSLSFCLLQFFLFGHAYNCLSPQSLSKPRAKLRIGLKNLRMPAGKVRVVAGQSLRSPQNLRLSVFKF